MEFPLTFGLQKAGLPLILTSGKTNNLCFLIDTGATHNTLFDFVYEHFKSEFKLLEGIYRTMGIEGHYKETPIIEATFNFEGRDYTSTFSVLDASGAIRQVDITPATVLITETVFKKTAFPAWTLFVDILT